MTLIELLIYVALAIVITAAVAQALISMIRSDRNIEVQQRAIDLWGRISFLIESEVAEGSRVLYWQPVPCAGGGTSLFSVEVPVLTAAGTAERTVAIHYLSRATAGGGAGPTESPSRVGWCGHAGPGFVGTAPVRWPTPLPLLI